jgi:hypothetical protein
MMVLLPCDVLRPRRVDEHFAAEADAARDAGLDVALVDHDALGAADGAARAVARVPQALAGGRGVYRGWMLSAERYAAFAAALAGRQVVLCTGAEQYRRAHELPGWYSALEKFTPRSVWTVGVDRDDFAAACRDLGSGPAVLRDYTKSMKHYWHEAAFIPHLEDAVAAWTVASRLLELRGDDFTGGFVLRRFETFASAEARTWWVNGRCRLIGAHPDTPQDQPPADLDLSPLEPVVAGLGLPWVTVDLAWRTDGVWRVIELGDAQVSDRPASISADTFIAAFTDVC